MSRPERQTRTSPGNDAIRIEDRGLDKGLVKRVTVTSKSGTVIFEHYKDGSLGINVSSDSGIGERVILGGVGSLENAVRKLKPKKDARR